MFGRDKTIEQYEWDLAKERMDKIVKENQNEKKKQGQLMEKMKRKQERIANLKTFKGQPMKPRSEKVAFKPVVVKKDTRDEQTKDEQEYLGMELFGILKQVKTKINKGEFEEEDEAKAEEPDQM